MALTERLTIEDVNLDGALGTSGYDHLFDFVIPKSRRTPERILRAINCPSRATAETFIHAWSDTREVRSPESEAYAILNDREQSVAAGLNGVAYPRPLDINPRHAWVQDGKRRRINLRGLIVDVVSSPWA